MKHTLPSLIAAFLVLAAATSVFSQAAPSTLPAGQDLLAQGAQRLYRQPALSAKIRQRVRIFGQELVGSGAYLQMGDVPEKMLRLELKLQLAGQVSTLQQVSNGAELWTRRQVLDAKTLSYVDLQRVRRELAVAREKRPLDLTADWMVLGGLPALLTGLEESFRFGAAQPAQFNQMAVWVIEGAWKPAELAKFLPNQKAAILAGQPADTRSLPPEVPERVQVVLGMEDLFPYQIEFRRHKRDEPGKGDAAGQGSLWEPMLTMELYEVQFGAQLDPLQFQYKPGTQEVADHTDVYLRKFGLLEPRVAERSE